jgi:hypothetical protein
METDKLNKEQAVYETVMQFLEWLTTQCMEVGRWEEHPTKDCFCPDNTSHKSLALDFLGVDEQVLEEERRRLIPPSNIHFPIASPQDRVFFELQRMKHQGDCESPDEGTALLDATSAIDDVGHWRGGRSFFIGYCDYLVENGVPLEGVTDVALKNIQHLAGYCDRDTIQRKNTFWAAVKERVDELSSSVA